MVTFTPLTEMSSEILRTSSEKEDIIYGIHVLS